MSLGCLAALSGGIYMLNNAVYTTYKEHEHTEPTSAASYIYSLKNSEIYIHILKVFQIFIIMCFTVIQVQ